MCLHPIKLFSLQSVMILGGETPYYTVLTERVHRIAMEGILNTNKIKAVMKTLVQQNFRTRRSYA